MAEQLENIKQYFDAKFSEFKKEFTRGCSTEKPIKAIVLKSKANQVQLDFNSELLAYIKRIESFANEENELILDTCTDMTKVIKRRNKLILLADKSPGGWLTVHQYEQDDLASDDEDSRKIKKAEKAAASIMKEREDKKRLERRKQPGGYRYSPYPSSGTFVTDGAQIPAQRTYFAPPQQATFRPSTPEMYWRPRFATPRASDQCFACGKYGHYRANCPHDQYSQKQYSDATRAVIEAATINKKQ